MPRPRKKPNYNPEIVMKELVAEVVELYATSEKEVSIRQIADEFDMTPLKIRKLLITAGVFSSDICAQVLELSKCGKSVLEIQKITGLSRASVHSYLPYSKIVYNAVDMSVNAERIRLYRGRKEAVHNFRKHMKESGGVTDILVEELWKVIAVFEKYPFYTMKGFRFTYHVKGNEIFVSRKEKSITRSSVILAMKKAIELQNQVKGPKQLETFGASYLYPIFVKIGLIERVKGDIKR